MFQGQPAVEEAVVLRGAHAGEHVAVAPEHDEHHESDSTSHSQHDQDHAPEFKVAARILQVMWVETELVAACDYINQTILTQPDSSPCTQKKKVLYQHL